MDPVTLLAAATAAYNGVKKAVEIGREVSDVYSQLSTWAGHVGDLKDAIEHAETVQARPSLFKKIIFDKSDTAEAFDLYAAKQKIKEMEDEIFHMFVYGDLCHLGIDGYREFKRMRQEVRDKRKNLIQAQIDAQKDFIDAIKTYGIVLAVLTTGGAVLFWMLSFLF